MKKYFNLLRVEQWVKTFLYLFLFSFQVKYLKLIYFILVFAFLIFSLTASSIYIINDYMDIDSDRQHPEKKTDL